MIYGLILLHFSPNVHKKPEQNLKFTNKMCLMLNGFLYADEGGDDAQ